MREGHCVLRRAHERGPVRGISTSTSSGAGTRIEPISSNDAAFYGIEQVILSLFDGSAVPRAAPALHFEGLVFIRIAYCRKTHVSQQAVAVGVDENVFAFDVSVDLWAKECSNEGWECAA
jgi:hypothetical protein